MEYAEELLAKPSGDFELGMDPDSGNQIVAKDGRYGPYVTEILPEGTPKTGKNAVKPRTASLFKSMSLDTVTLADALKLMSLPRVVGKDPEGVEITAQNGRYGPYLKKGTDSRSLETEDQLFTHHARRGAGDLRAAQAARAGRRQAAAEGAGHGPGERKPVVVKDGRFGAYVTDGETNATLRRDDDVETITPERGYELLAEKRAKGPAKKTAKKARQEGAGQEDGGEEDGRQEDARRRRPPRRRRRPPRRPPPKTAAAARRRRRRPRTEPPALRGTGGARPAKRGTRAGTADCVPVGPARLFGRAPDGAHRPDRLAG